MKYLVRILIWKRESVLDAEAKAIKSALESMGFDCINSLRYAKSVSYVTNQRTKKLARRQVEKICEDYLAISVNETYEISSVERLNE